MIETKGLARKWGDFQLGEIWLQVEAGEYFVILGPCGCGKTLLLETIAGLHLPHDGEVWLHGRNVTRLVPEKRKIGFVYQELCLFPHLSVRQNIAYGLRYRRMKPREIEARVAEMIDLLSIGALADRRTLAGLSGGESQKVALARALAIGPEVLLLDEPLGALDYVSRAQISQVLREINESLGVTVVHVTHDYTEAAAMGHQVAVMADGQTVQVGTVNEVFWKPNSRFVAEFLGVENLLQGHIEPCDGDLSCLHIGPTQLVIPRNELEGDVLCSIRPEDVIVSSDHPPVGNNALSGRVQEVREMGFSVRMVVEADGLLLRATLPRARYRELRCTVGDNVRVALPPDAIHVFREEV